MNVTDPRISSDNNERPNLICTTRPLIYLNSANQVAITLTEERNDGFTTGDELIDLEEGYAVGVGDVSLEVLVRELGYQCANLSEEIREGQI